MLTASRSRLEIALPELVRSLLGLSVVLGGLAVIVYLAVARSIDDAARFSGILGGLIGSVVTYYFTRGFAQAAEERAVEATLRKESVEGEVRRSVPATEAIVAQAAGDHVSLQKS